MVEAKIHIDKVSYAYGENWVLNDVTLDIAPNSVTVFFGPAGGGKTTLLRLINRLNDLVEGTQMKGRILVDGQDIYNSEIHIPTLRRRVGMVFALPLPLPGTVRENVLYGLKLAGVKDRSRLDEILEQSLTQSALWDEVKDRLDHLAVALSGGQQQRLCIARSLALEPDILLLDEPTSGLDPISTRKVEDSLFTLKEHYTVIIVPHSIQQAARIADKAAFFLMGNLVEYAAGTELFTRPRKKKTEEYVTGRFG
ncbi:MAG: phosphate ABC transporter ATP-binding protein [Deltaproteobacteria bacterium]|nr:phosphate ABC transporter ATP-binding protein [Deltaproteobacteria bacterium]